MSGNFKGRPVVYSHTAITGIMLIVISFGSCSKTNTELNDKLQGSWLGVGKADSSLFYWIFTKKTEGQGEIEIADSLSNYVLTKGSFEYKLVGNKLALNERIRERGLNKFRWKVCGTIVNVTATSFDLTVSSEDPTGPPKVPTTNAHFVKK